MELGSRIEVKVEKQQLFLYVGDRLIFEAVVSTSQFGLGEKKGSYMTPKGRHIVRAKIGDKVPVNSVFVGRRLTGEVYSSMLERNFPQRDWVLTRILWLSGLEVGGNRLGDVDSMQRFIYIHGTPDTEPMGEPHSKGCIRMRNNDVVTLFDLVDIGTPVYIAK